MKILIVADNIDFQTSSGAKANWAFATSLASTGNDIKVLHYSLKDFTSPIMNLFAIKEIRNRLYFYSSRIQRIIRRYTGINIPKILQRKYGFDHTFKNNVNSIIRALRKENLEKYDIIITLSQGAWFYAHAALLEIPNLHAKWLAYIHDPYPFFWYPKPYAWKDDGFIQKQNFILAIAKNAKWLGYPSKLLAEWMGQYHNDFVDKSIILRHQAIDIKYNKDKIPDYFPKNKFIALHSGNLLKERNPYFLISAWIKFLSNCPQAKLLAKLVLLGPSGAHEPRLGKTIQQHESILQISGETDYILARMFEMTSSVNIVLEAKSEISPFLPAKVSGLIKAGKPILHLGPYKSEVSHLLGETYKWKSEADDINKIAGLFEELFKEWQSNKDLLFDRQDLEFEISERKLSQDLQTLVAK